MKLIIIGNAADDFGGRIPKPLNGSEKQLDRLLRHAGVQAGRRSIFLDRCISGRPYQ